jgi:haloalkane dehalogenase
VRIVGAEDPYLNAGLARHFARLFPAAELRLVPNARHYVQVDEPRTVAAAVLGTHGTL